MSNKITVVSIAASINAESLVTKEVLFPSTYGLRWLKNKGRNENAFIVVDHSFDKATSPEAQTLFEKCLDNGIDLNGIHYVPAFAGSSHIRKGESVWMDVSIKDEFLSWLHVGVNTRHNMVANKTLVYDGMSAMSSTKVWEDVFGNDPLMPIIDIDKVAIFKDGEINFTGTFDWVNNGVVKRENSRTVPNKFTDGANLYVVNDDGLSNNQRNRLLQTLEAFTFRAPGFKGLAQPILKSALRRWVITNGCGYKVTDMWATSTTSSICSSSPSLLPSSGASASTISPSISATSRSWVMPSPSASPLTSALLMFLISNSRRCR